jgi:hypothetical protein
MSALGSVINTVTAVASPGAVAITSNFTQISTCPNTGQAQLPANAPIGSVWAIRNDGANTLTVIAPANGAIVGTATLATLTGGMFVVSGNVTGTTALQYSRIL